MLISLEFYSIRDIRFRKRSLCSGNCSSIFINPISYAVVNHVTTIVVGEVFPTISLFIGSYA